MSSAPARFEQLPLSARVLEALDDVGYETPSPIQAMSIPLLLEGKDLLGQAQTGTGKTAAFALPILSLLSSTKDKAPVALVLTPTRELAIQVAEAFKTYAKHIPGFKALPVYGGQSMSIQLSALRKGVNVVVGTPGRIMDHLRRGTLNLKSLETLVLDEADEMLRMGFIDDVEWILEHTPKERQIALFSATMPPTIKKVAHRHLKEPAEVKIASKTTTVDTIDQYYWSVNGGQKQDALTRVLEAEEFDAAIIFVRTKTSTVQVTENLQSSGYACAALNGDISQQLRERTVEQLKSGKIDIIVATDVAARGLDVPRISLVVNFDIPSDTEPYVHRIGRTGRAGSRGKAILFVTPRENRMLKTIERATKQTIAHYEMPTANDLMVRRVEQFNQQVLAIIEQKKLGFCDDIVTKLHTEHDLSYEKIASALAYLVQKDKHLQVKEAAHPRKARPIRESSPRERDRADKARSRKHLNRADRVQDDSDKTTYRLEVGRNHGIQVSDIVGAIANEAGLDSQHIGRIKLEGDHSLVDLPEGMPMDVYQHLKGVRIKQNPMNISRLGGNDEKSDKKLTLKRKKKGPPIKKKLKPAKNRAIAKPKRKTAKSD